MEFIKESVHSKFGRKLTIAIGRHLLTDNSKGDLPFESYRESGFAGLTP